MIKFMKRNLTEDKAEKTIEIEIHPETLRISKDFFLWLGKNEVIWRNTNSYYPRYNLDIPRLLVLARNAKPEEDFSGEQLYYLATGVTWEKEVLLAFRHFYDQGQKMVAPRQLLTYDKTLKPVRLYDFLKRLLRKGLIERVQRGFYSLTDFGMTMSEIL